MPFRREPVEYLPGPGTSKAWGEFYRLEKAVPRISLKWGLQNQFAILTQFVAYSRLLITMTSGCKRWLASILIPVLCLTGPGLQVCFCHSHDDHEGHEHSAQAPGASETAHRDHHHGHHHASAAGPTFGSDSRCPCVNFDSRSPADLAKEGQRLTQKKHAKPGKITIASAAYSSSASQRVVRISFPATPGGGHSPPCPLFILHCSFLI